MSCFHRSLLNGSCGSCDWFVGSPWFAPRAKIAVGALGTSGHELCQLKRSMHVPVRRGGRGGGAAAAQSGSAQGSAGSDGETAQSQLLDVQAMETQASTTSLSSGDGGQRPGASLDLQGKESTQSSGQVCRSRIHPANLLSLSLKCQSQDAQDMWVSYSHGQCCLENMQHLRPGTSARWCGDAHQFRAAAAWAQIVGCQHLRQE